MYDEDELYAYAASSRKCLTLCIVMRAVGDEEMMMMGWLCPAVARSITALKYICTLLTSFAGHDLGI